jgi:hypothetical protein
VKGKRGKDPLPKVSSWVDLVATKVWLRVSQSTTLEPAAIIKNTLQLLDSRNYNIVDESDNMIAFKERPWVLMWNFQAVRRLDGGYFRIGIVDKEQSVTLNYYFNILPFVIAFTAMEIFTISDGLYDGTLFFAIGFPIICGIQILFSKGVARGVLREILSDEIIDQ